MGQTKGFPEKIHDEQDAFAEADAILRQKCEEPSTLSWLEGLDSFIAEHSVAKLGDLTKAEKDQLSKVMKSILK